MYICTSELYIYVYFCYLEDGCPEGQIAFLEDGTEQPLLCSPDVSAVNLCPRGFTCINSPKLQRYQCCGVSAGCPGRTAAYISAVTGYAQACGPEQPNVCPPGFACAMTLNGDYVCCSVPYEGPVEQILTAGRPPPSQQTTAVGIPFPPTNWTPPIPVGPMMPPTQAEPDIFRVQMCPDGTEPLLRGREAHPCPCPEKYSCVMDRQICCLSKIPQRKISSSFNMYSNK